MSQLMTGGLGLYHLLSKPITQIDGVGYGEKATAKIKPGVTYQSFVINTNLAEEATLLKFELELNGVVIMQGRGSDLKHFDKYKQTLSPTGRFVLDLAKQEYRSLPGVRMSELVTEASDQVYLNLYFAAKGTTDPATLDVKLTSWHTDNQGSRTFIPKLEQKNINIAGASEFEWIYPNASPTRKITRMHFDETDVGIKRIKVLRRLPNGNDVLLHEITREDNDFALEHYGQFKPQAGVFTFDPTLFGFGVHGQINTGEKDSLIFMLDVDNGGLLRCLVEGIEQVKPLNSPQPA